MGYVAAALGIISLIQGRKGKKAANRAAEREAAAEKFLTGAKLENLRVDERVLRGQTIAAVAGSGIEVGTGSPLQILAEQARAFGRERAIVKQVGATKVAAGLQRGRDVGNQYMWQGVSGALNAAAMAFGYYKNKGP